MVKEAVMWCPVHDGEWECAGHLVEEPQALEENVPKPKNDFSESLTHSVKSWVIPLKKLQKQQDQIEAKFERISISGNKHNDICKLLLVKIHKNTGKMEGLRDKEVGGGRGRQTQWAQDLPSKVSDDSEK